MAERSLPQGVVTFLFTDIEGSTRLLQATGDDFVALLEAHREVLRAAFGAHGGREVSTDGDGFFAAFASPSGAVLAAVQAQRELGEHPLLAAHGVKVRMGMNTGEAQLTGHDYVGLAVHHAARVANAGHGGQVLVADSTRMMAGDLDDVTFEDLGEHVLKDFARRVRIFQLRGDGLQTDFPPIRSLNRVESMLPSARTSFVGRAEDLNALLIELAEPGLLTLTGAGGTGKTRLAIEAAREVRGSLHGAWFVDLHAVADGSQVASVAASALEVLDAGEPDRALERMSERIGETPCLIVLDNCEHLVEAVAELADGLLARCPNLRLLATSRDLLGLAHERAHRLPPLDLASATALFTERAARLVRGFTPDREDRRLIETICRRLDGIPLAIELAASRVRHMSLQDLANGLDDVFRLVVGTPGRDLQRHQTLHALVDWSHDLLSPIEQVVLRRLSALAGSFTMEAAEAVAGGDPVGGPVAEIVFRLVDRSLVEHVGASRYRQLAPLRAYGRAKLDQSDEVEVVRDRHVGYFLALAEQLGEELRGGDFFGSLERLDLEANNLRAALDFARARADHAAILRLVAATAQFAAITARGGYLGVAAEIVGSITGPRELLAAAHVGLAMAATAPACAEYAAHAEQAMQLLGPKSPDGDELDELRAWALASQALLSATGEPPDRATTSQAARRAKALGERCGLPLVAIAADSALAWDHLRADELDEARALLAQVRAAGDTLSGSLWFALALFWSGIAAMRAGDWAAATKHYRRVLPMFRRVSHKQYEQWTLDHLSVAALSMGDFGAARAYAEEGITVTTNSGIRSREESNLAYLYERLGYLEALRGDHLQAAQYYENALDLVSADRRPHDHAALRANLASTRVQTGELEAAHLHALAAIEVTEGLEPLKLETGAVQPAPVANVVQAVARWALAMGMPEAAAELTGVVSVLHPLDEAPPQVREYAARFHAAIAEALGGPDLLATAMERGKLMDDPLAEARRVLASGA